VLTIEGPDRPVEPGTPFPVSVLLQNVGNAAAAPVLLHFAAPASARIVSVSSVDLTCGLDGRCRRPVLEPGDSANAAFSLVLDADPGSSIEIGFQASDEDGTSVLVTLAIVVGARAAPAAPTGTPQPTPTPTPTGLASAASTDAPEERAADKEPSDPGLSVVLRGIGGPDKVFDDPATSATNLFLALFVVVALMVATTLFNTTLEENDEEIAHALGGMWAPLAAVVALAGSLWRGASAAAMAVPRFVYMPTTLLLAGVIYGFLDPSFGFNSGSAALFLSLVISIALVTYVYEGGIAWMQRRHGARAVVRPFPASILIAVVFVVLCRALSFQPGIVFGFVAASVVLAPVRMTRRDEGWIVVWPALALLTLGIAAWFLVWPLTDALGDSSNAWEALPLAVAAGVVAVAAEGLFGLLLPLSFTDGEKLWRWHKVIWFLMFLVAGFLCVEVVLQQEQDYFDALKEAKVLGVGGVLALYVAVGVGTWLFFKLRRRGDELDILGAEDEPVVHGGG
jgi:hypothetical protein